MSNLILPEKVLGFTGGRDYDDPTAKRHIYRLLDGIAPDYLIFGDARGADSVALAWAREREIPFEGHPAPWKKLASKGAGHFRNRNMANKALFYAEHGSKVAWAAVPGGNGTNGMVDIALERGIYVYDER